MLRDVLIPVVTPGTEPIALEAALALSHGRSVHLTVLRLVELPYPVAGPWLLGPDPRLLQMYDELRGAAAADVDGIRAALARVGVSHDVRLVECRGVSAAEALAIAVLCTDLVVIGPGEGEQLPACELAVPLTLKSGRPLLTVSRGSSFELPARRVVVAWKPAREAARAVHDAMELLVAAEQVDVVTVDDGPEAAEAQRSSVPLIAHLRRHGVRASPSHLDPDGASTGAVLQRHAADTGAQLIVAGAYGHSRMREWVLGGVTHELLRLPGVPVLFSH